MSQYPEELLELVAKVLEAEAYDRARAAERLEREAFENEELQVAILESWIRGALSEVMRRRAIVKGTRRPAQLEEEDQAPPPDTRGLVAMGERNLLEFHIDGKRLGDMRRSDLVKARRRFQHLARWLVKIETRLPEGVRVRDQFEHYELEQLLERARGME